MLTCLLLYCRAGFEKECATEIMEQAAALGFSGYAKAKPDSAYVVFTPHDAEAMPALAAALRLERMVFARQLIFSSGLVAALPVAHRTVPLLEAARALGARFGSLLLETADTNEAKETLAFCRKFEPHMRKALEESGLIVGYRALVDAKKLGLSLMALVHISMDRHTPERFANFEASVSVLPEVLECLLITGQDADYQIKVAVRDMDHYQALLLNKLTRIEGVTGVHSSFVLRRVVDRTALSVASAP